MSSARAGRPGAAVLAALALLVWLAPVRAGAAESSLADLQQAVTRAVETVSPVVVRVIAPELTKAQRDAAAKEERERRLREMEPNEPPVPPEEAPPEGAEPPQPSDEAPAAPDEPGKAPAPAEEPPPAEGAKAEEKPTEKTPTPAETAAASEATGGKHQVRTGLLVSSDGLVITSRANVGPQWAGLKVELPDGRVFPAKRLGEDFRRDTVLLKIEAKDLPVARVAKKSDLAVGQWVLALGRTLPVEKPTVSKGIISATGRMAGLAIQTDADVSPMNYGGALVDLQGRVVAMIAAVSIPLGGATAAAERFSDSGIGFAIPLEDIMAQLPVLKQGKRIEPPFLGIRFNMVRLEKGALVMEVIPGTGAKASGLAAGDVITEFEGRAIESPFQLLYEIGSRNVGDKVTFKVLRNGETLTLTAVLQVRAERFR